MFQDDVSATQQQDQLRPFRQFVGLLNVGLNGDQAYAGTDAYVYRPPGQFASVGPYSTSIEGKPITTTSNGAVVISPVVVLLIAGAAIALILKA